MVFDRKKTIKEGQIRKTKAKWDEQEVKGEFLQLGLVRATKTTGKHCRSQIHLKYTEFAHACLQLISVEVKFQNFKRQDRTQIILSNSQWNGPKKQTVIIMIASVLTSC